MSAGLASEHARPAGSGPDSGSAGRWARGAAARGAQLPGVPTDPTARDPGNGAS